MAIGKTGECTECHGRDHGVVRVHTYFCFATARLKGDGDAAQVILCHAMTCHATCHRLKAHRARVSTRTDRSQSSQKRAGFPRFCLLPLASVLFKQSPITEIAD